MNIKEKSVKDLIITILADEWPLTLKKIYNKIKKKYSLSITYQAVHKAMNELKEKGVIEKDKKVYKLNIHWIKNIKDFSERLERSYKRKVSFLESGHFTVDTIWELYYTFVELFKKDIFDADNKSICYIGPLVPSPQIGSEKQIEDYKKLAKKYNFFMVATSHSLLNKIWKIYWEKIGIKVKINTKILMGPVINTFIVGYFVIQIFFHEKATEELKKLREKVKKISDINIKKINEIYFKNYGKIHVIATKNKELATLMRNQVETLFSKK